MLIITAIQDKETRSRLEALYNKYSTMMYRVSFRILNDEYLAQDAVQEAFINISNNFDKVIKTDCNKLRALFVICVRNVAIDIYRLKKKQYSLNIEDIEDTLSEPGPGVEEILMSNETFTRVAEKIKELHPSYADILALKYFYYYKDEEISRMLNITPDNTRTRLHRARKSLIKLLSEEQDVNNIS